MGDSTRVSSRGLWVSGGDAGALVVNAARDRLDEAAAGTIAMRERTGKPHPLGRCTADDLWQIRESLLGHFDGNALAAMEQPGPHENEEDLLLALAIVDEEIERRDWPS